MPINGEIRFSDRRKLYVRSSSTEIPLEINTRSGDPLVIVFGYPDASGGYVELDPDNVIPVDINGERLQVSLGGRLELVPQNGVLYLKPTVDSEIGVIELAPANP